MLGRQSDISHAERLIQSDGHAILIASRNEACARGGAHRGVRIRLSEFHSAGSDTVNIGRLVIAASIAGKIRISEIVGHYKNNVGRRVAGEGKPRTKRQHKWRGRSFQDIPACH